jgi:hypothetical protein
MGRQISLQRRLVERYAVDELEVGWNVRTVRPLLGRRRRVSAQGRLVDVSVAGAAILAPADVTLTPRSSVVVDVDGELGVVTVRNVRETVDPTASLYGVEFTELTDEARRQLLAPIEDLRGHVPSWEWIGEVPRS